MKVLLYLASFCCLHTPLFINNINFHASYSIIMCSPVSYHIQNWKTDLASKSFSKRAAAMHYAVLHLHYPGAVVLASYIRPFIFVFILSWFDKRLRYVLLKILGLLPLKSFWNYISFFFSYRFTTFYRFLYKNRIINK